MKKGLIKINNLWIRVALKNPKYCNFIYEHYISAEPDPKSPDKQNVYVYLSNIGKVLVTLVLPFAIIVGGFKSTIKEYKEAMNKPCSAYEISSELAKLLILVGKQ